MLKYIELKTGFSENGPAWIARVTTSKSGRTLYFNGKALKRAIGGTPSGNYVDAETAEEYWISGVKHRGTNRHWAGSGKILVEAAAVQELLALLGEPTLDSRRFAVSDSIKPTDPSKFVARENAKLQDR
jgi:hypothetical protein